MSAPNHPKPVDDNENIGHLSGMRAGSPAGRRSALAAAIPFSADGEEMNKQSLTQPILRWYLSLAFFKKLALVVGVGWLALVHLQAFRQVVQQSQRTQDRIDRMWSVVVAPSAIENGKISRKRAIEYLHGQGQSLQLVNLNGASLNGVELPGANLRMAILKNTVLENADLQSADLWRAVLNDAHLSGAKLRNIRLKGAVLIGARLDNTDLRGGDLTQADLTGADLRGARVTSEQLAKACGNPRSPPMVDKDVRPPTPWPRPCLTRK